MRPWPQDEFAPGELARLIAVAQESKGRLHALLQRDGEITACLEAGVLGVLSQIETNLDKMLKRLERSRKRDPGRTSMADLPTSSYDIEHDLLYTCDRLGYALSLMDSLGVHLSKDTERKIADYRDKLGRHLPRLLDAFEAAGDSLYPEAPELFPKSFWWRHR